MRLSKTTIVVFLSKQSSTLFGFVATFYIASQLGSEVLGTYSVAIGIVFWAHLPASAINSAITKRVSEGVDQGEKISAGILLDTTICVAVVTGFLIFSSSINDYVGRPVNTEITVFVVTYFASNFMGSVLSGQKKVAESNVISTASQVARTGFQIGLTVFLGLGLSGLIWGHSISLLLAVVLALVTNSVKLTWPSKVHFNELYEYARYSWLGKLSAQAFNWLDTVILALFVSSNLIGVYEVAWTMASALSAVSQSIGTTLFPTFSELSTDSRQDEIRKLLSEGLTFTGIIIIPGLAGALTVGSRVLEIYGSEYGQGGIILVLLVTARLTSEYNDILKNTINAIDRPDIGFKINAVLVISNVVLNFSLIPIFGWYGAAIGTASSAAIGLLVGYYWVNKIIFVHIPYQEIGFQVVASLVMVLAVLGLSQVLGSGRIGTVVIVFLAAGVYSVVLMMLSETVRQKTMSILSDYPYLRALL